MEHRHEPIVTLDGLIKCKDCGKILENTELELAKVNSATMARRLLGEIAVAGKYQVKSMDGFPVYSREQNGILEEITGEKLSARNYRIYKTLSMVGGDV